ncbi:MAG TPA: SBBP repeat-containing protein [Terriglobia bacterium]|nr:SBBP repeat-containing protein [Terriglobia bacterium]
MSRSSFRLLRPLLIALCPFGSFAVAVVPLCAQTFSLSTYYGANGLTFGTAMATDTAGNVFLVSSTSSSLPCSGQLTGAQNVLVTMINSNGTLGWCTYLGGTNTDYGNGIALDVNDNIYVAGMTNSSGLGTPGSYQSDFQGNEDAFVAELSPSGSLSWFTYLGTSGSSQANSVYVDFAGGIYITGYTTAGGWPVAGSVRQKRYSGGGSDIAIAKLNAGGSTLAWSGYLGGRGDDVAYHLAVSADGSLACVDGYTTSLAYPTTAGAFQRSKNATRAAVVTCLDPSTGETLASTYFGGSTSSNQPCNACATGVAFDASDNIWIAGLAQNETGFPITGNAAQPLFAGGLHDAFISELNWGLSTVLYST